MHKAWRREDSGQAGHYDFYRAAIFAACWCGWAANMAALQEHDCCDRARRADVFRRLRIDRAGG